MKGNLVAADLFVQFGVNLNLTTNRGDSPLHFAAVNGHVQMTRFLISMGAKSDSISIESHFPEVIRPILLQAMGNRHVRESAPPIKELLNLTVLQGEHISTTDSLVLFVRYGREERKGERRGVREQVVEWNEQFEFPYHPELPSLLVYLFRPSNLSIPFAMTVIRIENGTCDKFVV